MAALDDLQPLDPQSLGPMAEAAERALLQEGESPHTLRSYRSALRYWAAWYALRYRSPIALPRWPPQIPPPLATQIPPGKTG